MKKHAGTVESFHVYQQRTREMMERIALQFAPGSLDEQAVPAYTRGWRLSRWVFWQRLRVISRMVLSQEGERCLDFGCGTGVLLPLLSQRFGTVHAVDTKTNFVRAFIEEWERDYGGMSGIVRLHDSLDSAAIPDDSLDLVLTLDVLEHVKDLDGTLLRIGRLLKPDGTLIVTGPTENWIYRLGRAMVGFSGDYHHRSIHHIEQAMRRVFEVKRVKRVPFPFVLFHVLAARRR